MEGVYGTYAVSAGRQKDVVSEAPPPETRVLLGYLKSPEHWDWIHATKSYNVRTEERVGGVPSSTSLLYCQLLLLYCPALERVALARVVSDPELVDKHAMERTGYPAPTSDYWCIQLRWVSTTESIATLSAADVSAEVASMGKRKGEPTATSWSALIAAASLRWAGYDSSI